MKLTWSKRTLNFIQPAGTSRGVMTTRDVWYLFFTENGVTRIGECAPLPGLSIDDFDILESKLDEICAAPELYISDLSLLHKFPSIRFGLEMAFNKRDTIFPEIPINGLIWMGSHDFMIEQVEEKLKEGWRCIKIKIGALDFDDEIKILELIRSRYNSDELELRVDANGAFTEYDVREKLERLSVFDLHSIEQPIKAGNWELLAELCRTSPVSVALDEELIPLLNKDEKIELLDKVRPQYLVLKPSLLGGFAASEEWIRLAEKRNIGWWVTSALESNIGLNAIAQWISEVKPAGYQGLGTGKLFANNIPGPLSVTAGNLYKSDLPIWQEINSFIKKWLSSEPTMELATSGSTGVPKTIIVQKDWMRNSAALTKKTFGLAAGDSVLLCMPMSYIAAKMMVVRAIELGLELKVMEPGRVVAESVDFAAMVPLQLENSLDYIENIKTIIVGGGKVHLSLVDKLQGIKTRIFETYGMTETLTHVAIKALNGPNKSDVFKALDGVEFDIDAKDCLIVYAPRLNPTPVHTNDVVKLISKRSFRWLGRYDNVINSGGVKLFPEIIEEKLRPIIQNTRFFITGQSDESLGEKVILVVEGDRVELPTGILSKYEMPKEIVYIDKFIETESGKINRLKTLGLEVRDL